MHRGKAAAVPMALPVSEMVDHIGMVDHAGPMMRFEAYRTARDAIRRITPQGRSRCPSTSHRRPGPAA
jgi:hypothetical protein